MPLPSNITGINVTGAMIHKTKQTPVWGGPEKEGITSSLLSRFLACRERFRLLVIEGLKPVDRFQHKISYGNMWHVCEEHHAAETAQRTPLLQEHVFDIPYKLLSGRVVKLRGKMDGVDLVTNGIWLVEHKTKGDVKPEQLRRQLSFDLQTMMYTVALLHSEKIGSMPYTFKGVRYNVIRRPLSGGKGSIVQKKGSKNVPAETTEEYYARLAQYIKDEPENYFYRWNVTILPRDIERFKQRFLNPILEQLYLWWDLVSHPAFGKNPFVCGQAYHWQHPFETWNPLDEGGSSELDAYLQDGSEVGLTRTNDLFPELH
jgi:hypothetical protein